MSKGKKKIKIRRTWNINPKTKVKESEKRYKRPKTKRELKNIIEAMK